MGETLIEWLERARGKNDWFTCALSQRWALGLVTDIQKVDRSRTAASIWTAIHNSSTILHELRVKTAEQIA